MSNNIRLTPLEKIGYGLGDFASNVVFQSILVLLPVFYTDVFGLESAVMGTLFLAVGGWLIGLILSGSGYSGQAEKQTPGAIKAILLSVRLFPAAAHQLLIPIVAFSKLNRQRCAEIRQQLDAKAAAGT